MFEDVQTESAELKASLLVIHGFRLDLGQNLQITLTSQKGRAFKPLLLNHQAATLHVVTDRGERVVRGHLALLAPRHPVEGCYEYEFVPLHDAELMLLLQDDYAVSNLKSLELAGVVFHNILFRAPLPED